MAAMNGNLADSMEDSSDYIPTADTAADLFRFILTSSQEYVSCSRMIDIQFIERFSHIKYVFVCRTTHFKVCFRYVYLVVCIITHE